MKILDKININQESKIYIAGAIYSIFALFIITAVIFIALIADKLDIVMSQPAKETYTYFISIIDRVLAFITIVLIIPISVYQLISKNKSKLDKSISIIVSFILIAFISIFFGGEYYFLKKYKDGELSYSKMFCKPTIETKIFDIIIKQNGEIPPTMCISPSQRPKKLNKS